MLSAVLVSAMSIADAVHHGLTGRFLLDDETAAPAVTIAVSALLAVTFALLAAVLREQAGRIDAGRRTVRWIRRAMQTVLVVLVVVFVGGPVVEGTADGSALHRIIEALGGAGFALMFLVGVVLGAALLRRAQLRPAAALMAAPIVVIPLTLLIATFAPDWAHPAYAETALYIGVALLGYRSSAQRDVEQAERRRADHYRGEEQEKATAG